MKFYAMEPAILLVRVAQVPVLHTARLVVQGLVLHLAMVQDNIKEFLCL